MGVGAWRAKDQALSVLWASVSAGPSCDTPLPPQVLPYDYYGAYGHRAHEDYTYGRLLGQEYTFSFPPHHDVVGPPLRRDRELGIAFGGRCPGEVPGGGSRGAPALSQPAPCTPIPVLG